MSHDKGQKQSIPAILIPHPYTKIKCILPQVTAAFSCTARQASIALPCSLAFVKDTFQLITNEELSASLAIGHYSLVTTRAFRPGEQHF
jgi:hypothetical protein